MKAQGKFVSGDHAICWEAFVDLLTMSAGALQLGCDEIARILFREAMELWNEHRYYWADSEIFEFAKLYAKLASEYPDFHAFAKTVAEISPDGDVVISDAHKKIMHMGLALGLDSLTSN